MKNYAIIMAGGVGSRFWPKGTSKLPKQFLKIAHDYDSMIQQSFKRLNGLVDTSRIFVVTSIKQKELVKKQLPQIHEENILCEPFGRNTAPCIGLACLFIKQFDPKGNVFVLPSDHIINDVKEFQRVVNSGLKYVSENGGIVTLGITPTKPETGYGYIKAGASLDDTAIFHIDHFTEKPDLLRAKKFLQDRNYYWNSGIFMFRASAFLSELAKYAADILQVCQETFANRQIDADFIHFNEDIFVKSPAISIDYAVMEKTTRGLIAPVEMGWSDVGSWAALAALKPTDQNGNVKLGDVQTVKVENSYMRAASRKLAVIGVANIIVIETADAVLVVDKNHCNDVKLVAE